MKLKEGMYVRTIKGKIGKIVDINLGMEQKRYILDSSNVFIYDREDITKSSHNIIDLIEKGDYVNGYKIERVDKPCKLNPYGSLKYRQNEKCDYEDILGNDIKSIVTKEQFESMSYKVGE